MRHVVTVGCQYLDRTLDSSSIDWWLHLPSLCPLTRGYRPRLGAYGGVTIQRREPSWLAPKRTKWKHKGWSLCAELAPSRALFPPRCISSSQQSPLPYSPTPSDHSQFSLTQSFFIYTTQREERVNVGNTLLSVKTVWADSLLCAISCRPCCSQWGMWLPKTSCTTWIFLRFII